MNKPPSLRELRERPSVAVVLAASLVTVAVAQRDLHRRPAKEIRGDKRVWRVVCLNAGGALVYLFWGRRAGG